MIDCEDIRFSYDGERDVVDGIDLHIRAGEFVCVLGGNGSGKSTLAKHFNALLVPDAGRVSVDGLDTADEASVYAIRSNAGMVFQNPDDQLVASLVEDDVAFGPENLGVPTPDIARRVGDALRDVGLVGFETHETCALSGGQKQRVAIAGALAMQPRVLILDEASSMLDPRGRRGLMRVCKRLHERGMTVVCITHFMDEAAEADRVVVLDRGRIALEGTPDRVLVETESLARLNLETPFACRFSSMLRARGVAIDVCIRENDLVERIAGLIDADAASCPAAVRDETPNAPARLDGRAPLVRFEHVSHTYLDAKQVEKNKKRGRGKTAAWGNDPHAIWALRDVDLEIREGEFLGVAGHTGSGKSTLIAHMNGILAPTRGRVLVCGEDIADAKGAKTARSLIGVVFQYPERQLFAPTVFDDVAFGPRNMGLAADEVEARVHEALALVGLHDDALLEASPFELSGGQQRRVAFAGVLAMRPRVLVLDEPAAGLDPAARREFLALVARLHEREGLTVVMVSHSMDDLASLCERIVVLDEGEIFAQGTPREVFARGDELERIGLGLPAARRAAVRLEELTGLPAFSETYDADELCDLVCAATRAPREEVR
ncbi:MAG: energy-coupling factor transporter ATPase [Slackia sp.]|nr:energy-coupling factor transporter ATPase [Slackia sp.]